MEGAQSATDLILFPLQAGNLVRFFESPQRDLQKVDPGSQLVELGIGGGNHLGSGGGRRPIEVENRLYCCLQIGLYLFLLRICLLELVEKLCDLVELVHPLGDGAVKLVETVLEGRLSSFAGYRPVGASQLVCDDHGDIGIGVRIRDGHQVGRLGRVDARIVDHVFDGDDDWGIVCGQGLRRPVGYGPRFCDLDLVGDVSFRVQLVRHLEDDRGPRVLNANSRGRGPRLVAVCVPPGGRGEYHGYGQHEPPVSPGGTEQRRLQI